MDMKKLAGDKAAEYVKDGMVVGLGTGSTAYHMVNAVGEMVKNGLKIQAIPTSKATEAQARELGIPLLTIDELDHVDLAIDGVDEIDPQFNAIKGGGGALYREKVVASMAKEVIWIMDESKLVDKIGAFHLRAVEIDDLHPDAKRRDHKGVQNGGEQKSRPLPGHKNTAQGKQYFRHRDAEPLSQNDLDLHGRHQLIGVAKRFEGAESGDLQTGQPEIEKRYDVQKHEVHP